MYVAVGGQDSTVSVWGTHDSRPVAVLRDVFETGVLDLAWSADGRDLYVVLHSLLSYNLCVISDSPAPYCVG